MDNDVYLKLVRPDRVELDQNHFVSWPQPGRHLCITKIGRPQRLSYSLQSLSVFVEELKLEREVDLRLFVQEALTIIGSVEVTILAESSTELKIQVDGEGSLGILQPATAIFRGGIGGVQQNARSPAIIISQTLAQSARQWVFGWRWHNVSLKFHWWPERHSRLIDPKHFSSRGFERSWRRLATSCSLE